MFPLLLENWHAEFCVIGVEMTKQMLHIGLIRLPK